MNICRLCRKGIGRGELCEDCGLKCLYCGTVNSPVLKDCDICRKPLFRPAEDAKREIARAFGHAVARLAVERMKPHQRLPPPPTIPDKLGIRILDNQIVALVNGEVIDAVPKEE